MESSTRVFVYGTLQPGGRYHERYCGGFQFQCRNARVAGWLFDFPQLGYPGAHEGVGQWIRGKLLSFSHPEEEILAGLDELEGYDPLRPAHRNEYYRKRVPVYALDGQPLIGEAWCYFMQPGVIANLKGIPLANGEWTV